MKADIEAHENVVLSGSLGGWGNGLVSYFNLAIRLQIDSSVRLARLRKREKAQFGSRIEVGGDMYLSLIHI